MAPDTKTYQIAGKTFRQEPLVLGQELWLIEQIFTGYTVTAMTAQDIWTIMRTKGARLFAILLIEDGQSRAQKVQAGLSGVDQLEQWFLANLSPADMMTAGVLADFFALNQQGNLALLVERPPAHDAQTTPAPNSST